MKTFSYRVEWAGPNVAVNHAERGERENKEISAARRYALDVPSGGRSMDVRGCCLCHSPACLNRYRCACDEGRESKNAPRPSEFKSRCSCPSIKPTRLTVGLGLEVSYVSVAAITHLHDAPLFQLKNGTAVPPCYPSRCFPQTPASSFGSQIVNIENSTTRPVRMA